jgi:hypothetical protein
MGCVARRGARLVEDEYRQPTHIALRKRTQANWFEFGAGFGQTNASDRMLLKLIINHSF